MYYSLDLAFVFLGLILISICVVTTVMVTGDKMAQHLLHGTLHATIYEVDALHGGGVRQGFLGKVYI